jgi:hypothetical protein
MLPPRTDGAGGQQQEVLGALVRVPQIAQSEREHDAAPLGRPDAEVQPSDLARVVPGVRVW